MADFITSRERLEKVLEKSDLYFVETGDGWTTRRDGAEVTFTLVGDLVRGAVRTGVIVTDENRAALRAMCDHMNGWEFKIAEFDVPAPGGEVTIFYDRAIDAAESPDGMARRLAHTLKDAGEKLRRVASGESPHDVSKSDRDLSDLLRGLGGHTDLADLLGN